VRRLKFRHIVGWFGFLPFVVSPRLWIAWHNRVHHGNTNRADIDPDAYPTLEAYRKSLAVRVATDFAAPGRKRPSGVLSLLIGFSVQSSHMLLVARKRGYLSKAEHARALGETLLGVAVWITLAWLVGPLVFLFAFVFPLLVANSIVMALILTNHSLSPMTGVNDPLVNSLTVTAPRWIEWLTLGFGYHVEHHLFPAMSARHAHHVRAVLTARWPDRYCSMPFFKALRALHRTARVYKNSTTLIDPPSGHEYPALTPESWSAAPVSAE
jgi:fatty acid desaturase